MEINVTRFFNEAEPSDFFASRMERGDNAGPETWSNAVTEGATSPLLVTEPQLDALRDWAEATGEWGREETTAWSDAECNALFIQLVSGDIRELESLAMGDDGEIDWDEAGRLAQAGTIAGNIGQGVEPGTVWFSLDA